MHSIDTPKTLYCHSVRVREATPYPPLPPPTHPPPPPPLLTHTHTHHTHKKSIDLNVGRWVKTRIAVVIPLSTNWNCALQNSFFFCHSPSKTTPMVMHVIAPVILLTDARKLIQNYRDLSCCVFDLTSYIVLWPHYRIDVDAYLWFSMVGAAETRSPGRQMRPMNPLADSMSYHGWSVRGPISSLDFQWNISEWKRTDDPQMHWYHMSVWQT